MDDSSSKAVLAMLGNLPKRPRPPLSEAVGDVAVTLDRENLALVVRLARAFRHANPKRRPSSVCLALISGRGPDDLRRAISNLEGDAFDYAVASIYSLLLSDERRRELGAYFTPPYLVKHLLNRLADHGFDCVEHSAHDPAAGGAAFVVPLVRMTASALLKSGVKRADLRRQLARRLSGTELDSGLARVANALIGRTLNEEFGLKVSKAFSLVRVGNSLSKRDAIANVVVGNPPYAKIGADRQRQVARAFPDILGGQLNLYAMFLRRSMDWVKPGGLVGFVVPTSFLQGPEFETLRIALLERGDLMCVDLIEKRSGVFLDVVQDACFVVLRRRLNDKLGNGGPTTCALVKATGQTEHQGVITLGASGTPWVLPYADGMHPGTSVLSDYGYRCSVGYLVANRQAKRLRISPGKGRVALARAACIRPNGSFDLAAVDRRYVTVPKDAPYIVRSPCVALQRTANRKQAKRLNAAAVSARTVKGVSGIVGENHVLFLLPVGKPRISPTAMARLMSSGPVNARWARICGTISVSAKLLSTLRLPHPERVVCLSKVARSEVDAVVSAAYELHD